MIPRCRKSPSSKACLLAVCFYEVEFSRLDPAGFLEASTCWMIQKKKLPSSLSLLSYNIFLGQLCKVQHCSNSELGPAPKTHTQRHSSSLREDREHREHKHTQRQDILPDQVQILVREHLLSVIFLQQFVFSSPFPRSDIVT